MRVTKSHTTAAVAPFSCCRQQAPRLYSHRSAAALVKAAPQAPPTPSNLAGYTPAGAQDGTDTHSRSPVLEPPIRGRPAGPSRGGRTEGAAAGTIPLEQHCPHTVGRGQGCSVNHSARGTAKRDQQGNTTRAGGREAPRALVQLVDGGTHTGRGTERGSPPVTKPRRRQSGRSPGAPHCATNRHRRQVNQVRSTSAARMWQQAPESARIARTVRKPATESGTAICRSKGLGATGVVGAQTACGIQWCGAGASERG